MPIPKPAHRAATAAAVSLAALAAAACGGEESGGAASGAEPRADAPAPAQQVASATARSGAHSFASAPSVRPPSIVVRKRPRGTAGGYIFSTPSGGAGDPGLLIADESGEPVWHRATGDLYGGDLRVQRYRGKSVLTFWEGKRVRGWGSGDYVILGRDYREIARFTAGNGLEGDFHEYLLTDRDTALVTIYETTTADLRAVGGPRDGKVVENVIQEIEPETGRVVWEWRSLDHVDVRESYKPVPDDPKSSWDYMHLNSIDVGRDGDLLLSARNTHSLFSVDRRTGEVRWRLGGKDSDFAMGPGTRFAWQHDARWQGARRITLFDNQAAPKLAEESRGLALAVDERRRRATVAREYTHPRGLLSNNKANTQVLPNGNVLVGWGYHPYFTEHSPRGRLLYDARFADPENVTYRTYKFRWTGRPATRPRLAVARDGSRMTVRASWNGATEIARWRVLAGSGPQRLEPVGTGRRRGFETALRVRSSARCVAVRALDARGRVLGTSQETCR